MSEPTVYSEQLISLIEHGKASVELIKELINKGAELDARSEDGETPLLIAARRGYLEICRFFIERGADLNAQTTYGANALYIAVREGHHDVSMFLIQKGIDVDVVANDGTTTLFWAADVGDLELCKALIAKKAHVNRTIIASGSSMNWSMLLAGGTPLTWAIRSQHPQVCALLIQSGAEVNHYYEGTPLHVAVQYGNQEITELLLEAGADPNVKDEEGKTALNYALEENKTELARLLVTAGTTTF